MQTDSTFLPWLAGFVDGEGSIAVVRQKRADRVRYTPSLVVVSTDRPILESIRTALGFGGVYACGGRVGALGRPRTRAWYYGVRAQRALCLVAALRPHLRLKQDQADVLLRFETVPRTGAGDTSRAAQEALYWRLRAMKGSAARLRS